MVILRQEYAGQTACGQTEVYVYRQWRDVPGDYTLFSPKSCGLDGYQESEQGAEGNKY